MTISNAAYATLEILLNQTIRLDPQVLERLAPLHGRVIKLELLGLGQCVCLVPDQAGIQVYHDLEGEPDCILRGTPLDLARMRSSRESADQLFSGAVEIEGNSAIAQQFGDFISGLDIDWEEQLSQLTGDWVAHKLGNVARDLSSWGRDTSSTFGKNLQEYLQEELRLLPSRCEIESFLDDVDLLRDDVERLSARIDKLSQQNSESEPKQ